MLRFRAELSHVLFRNVRLQGRMINDTGQGLRQIACGQGPPGCRATLRARAAGTGVNHVMQGLEQVPVRVFGNASSRHSCAEARHDLCLLFRIHTFQDKIQPFLLRCSFARS